MPVSINLQLLYFVRVLFGPGVALMDPERILFDLSGRSSETGGMSIPPLGSRLRPLPPWFPLPWCRLPAPLDLWLQLLF